LAKAPLKGITVRGLVGSGTYGYLTKSLDDGLLSAYVEATGLQPMNFKKDSAAGRQWLYKTPGMRKQDPQEIAKAE
jgi:hypothetical protein